MLPMFFGVDELLFSIEQVESLPETVHFTKLALISEVRMPTTKPVAVPFWITTVV
jgi:hypothetical protein